MGWFYTSIVRPALFQLEPETAHDRAMAALRWANDHTLARQAVASFLSTPNLPQRAFGLTFPNPVGIAAGLDKQAHAMAMWEALGFGFCELGGVTLHPQDGNPKPRVFRLPDHGALINRMGFNNPGARAIAGRLAACRAAGHWPHHPVGINLGKSKITSLELAPADYAESFALLRQAADFFVINVSSPNTPGLRQLQERNALDEILAAVQEKNRPEQSTTETTPTRTSSTPRSGPTPILVKIAPDLEFDAIDDVLGLVATRSIAGVIATNTTLARPPVVAASTARHLTEAGGLSGRPLKSRSTEVIQHIFRQTQGHLPIIGVGGIFNASDAWEKIIAGASLVQLYTGLVYEGPTLARAIVRGLLERLQTAGFSSLAEAVGKGATASASA
jgi:dihydroorotate dehydrogenase